MHLFLHLLTSFSLCFSPLGVFLLSSMSPRISASLIDKSSITFAAADAVARASLLLFLISLALLLEWNTTERASIFLCCCQTCFFFIFCSFDQVWALFAFSPYPLLLLLAAGKCKVQPSTRPDVYAHSELKHSVGLSPCYCSSCFFFQSLVLLLPQVCDFASACCSVFKISLCFSVLPFFLCFSFFCGGGIFSTSFWYFSSSGISILMLF